MTQGKTGQGSHPPGSRKSSPTTTAADYIKAARAYLRNGEPKQAYSFLLKATTDYPNHPIILSYYGWLQAVVDKKHRSGITTCRKAFTSFKTSDPDTANKVYPFLYLNLGRAYLASGKKKEAVDSFEKGLGYDKGNIDLKREMKNLGTRKKPLVPFLSRSNPINKLAGKLIQQKKTTKR